MRARSAGRSRRIIPSSPSTPSAARSSSLRRSSCRSRRFSCGIYGTTGTRYHGLSYSYAKCPLRAKGIAADKVLAAPSSFRLHYHRPRRDDRLAHSPRAQPAGQPLRQRQPSLTLDRQLRASNVVELGNGRPCVRRPPLEKFQGYHDMSDVQGAVCLLVCGVVSLHSPAFLLFPAFISPLLLRKAPSRDLPTELLLQCIHRRRSYSRRHRVPPLRPPRRLQPDGLSRIGHPPTPRR